MKSTGIVRRIDDLGRVVIPKEIRKTLRIKDGESLEIFLEKDNIVLKKYSQLDDLAEFYKNYVDSIYSILDKDVIIVDRDKIVAATGKLRKRYIDKKISFVLDKMIQNRTLVKESKFKEFSLASDIKEKINFCMCPIIVNGDAIGAVIILSTDYEITEFDEKTALIASKFLSKHIE